MVRRTANLQRPCNRASAYKYHIQCSTMQLLWDGTQCVVTLILLDTFFQVMYKITHTRTIDRHRAPTYHGYKRKYSQRKKNLKAQNHGTHICRRPNNLNPPSRLEPMKVPLSPLRRSHQSGETTSEDKSTLQL